MNAACRPNPLPAHADAPPRRGDDTPDNHARAYALLAVRCQLGERAAFDDLIRRWAQPLRRYVVRVTSNPEAADERHGWSMIAFWVLLAIAAIGSPMACA